MKIEFFEVTSDSSGWKCFRLVSDSILPAVGYSEYYISYKLLIEYYIK